MGKKWKYVLTSVYKDVGGIQVLCSELCQVKFVHIPRCRRERVRLGTFRGFGTELARLGTCAQKVGQNGDKQLDLNLVRSELKP